MALRLLLYAAIWAAIIASILLGYYLVERISDPVPRGARINSVAEAEEIIAEGLRSTYARSRFDMVEVSVAECRIHVFLDESRACPEDGDPSTLRAHEEFVDLRAFWISRRKGRAWEAERPRADPQGWHMWVYVLPRWSFADEDERLQARANQILDEASREVGRGPHAAILYGERFLRENPLGSLGRWSRAIQCSGSSWVSPRLNPLHYRGTEPYRFTRALRIYSRACRGAD